MRKVKTSISLSRSALKVAKAEARRQRRSLSQTLELWIEDAFARKPQPVDAPTAEAIFSHANGD